MKRKVKVWSIRIFSALVAIGMFSSWSILGNEWLKDHKLFTGLSVVVFLMYLFIFVISSDIPSIARGKAEENDGQEDQMVERSSRLGIRDP